MQKKAGILFLLAFAAITVSGFCTPVSISVKGTDKQEFIFKSQELPNAELDRQQSHAVTFSLSAEKRTPGIIEQSFRYFAPVFRAIPLAAPFITCLPAKDYLFHIYPTHNFW